MTIVIDTNVLIAAFLRPGTSKSITDTIISRKSCVLSEYILEEFQRVLLSKKFKFPEPLVDSFVSYLRRYCRIEDENPSLRVESPDPDDQKILALCHTVKADFLITGDEKLLTLSKTGNTRIIRPAEFWKFVCS